MKYDCELSVVDANVYSSHQGLYECITVVLKIKFLDGLETGLIYTTLGALSLSIGPKIAADPTFVEILKKKSKNFDKEALGLYHAFIASLDDETQLLYEI